MISLTIVASLLTTPPTVPEMGSTLVFPLPSDINNATGLIPAPAPVPPPSPEHL